MYREELGTLGTEKKSSSTGWTFDIDTQFARPLKFTLSKFDILIITQGRKTNMISVLQQGWK